MLILCTKTITNCWFRLKGSQNPTKFNKNCHQQNRFNDWTTSLFSFGIWAGFGPVGNTVKNDWGSIMSNFWGCFFHVFRSKKIIPNFLDFTFHRYVLDAIYRNWMSPSDDDSDDGEESLRQNIFGTPTVDQISLFLRSIANSIDTFQRYEQ